MNDALTDGLINSDLEIKTIEYDPNGNPNSQRAVVVAAHENLDVVYPKDNQLLIDIDNQHSFLLYHKQMDIMRKYLGATEEAIAPSRNGGEGRHITVTLDHPITELERIALQACLGSDRVRELLGFVQYKNNDPHPTLFLEKKVEQKLLAENSLTPGVQEVQDYL
jgi:hypothetical protein